MLEIKSVSKQVVNIGDELYGESGLYILEGSIESDINVYGPKQLLVAKDSSLCEFTIGENSTIYIFGGEPFPEKRFIDWNFVSSSEELIDEAKQKWKEQSFPKIKGDETEFIPYPTIRRWEIKKEKLKIKNLKKRLILLFQKRIGNFIIPGKP